MTSRLILPVLATVLLSTVGATATDRDSYGGVLRVYVVEPYSRYQDNTLVHYPFGFLDFAHVGEIGVPDGGRTRQVSTWDGGYEFDDITSDNIMVIAVVSDTSFVWTDAYPPNGNMFKALYVDAAASALPGSPGSNLTAPGFSHTVFLEEASSGG